MKDNLGHGSNSGGGGGLGGGGSALPASQANFVQAMSGLTRAVADRMAGKNRTSVTVKGEKQLGTGRGAIAHQSGIDGLRGDGNPGAAQGAYSNVASNATAPGAPTGYYDPGPRVAENASAPRTGMRHYGLK